MTGKRYKVWLRDPDGQPGTFLLRTGSLEDEPEDIGAFHGTPAEVAIAAVQRHMERGGARPSVVLVKDFDHELCYTVRVSADSAVAIDGWTL